MKRLLPIAIGLSILGAFIYTLVFLYNKSRATPEVFETEAPAVRDVVKKTVATGSIVPRREIEIKSRISGVLAELYVQPGEYVESGQKIAKIKIIPNMVSLNSAEADVRARRISFENAKSEYERNQTLFERGVISETELSRFRLDYRLRQQELQAAQSNLQLIKSGAVKGGRVSNVVEATVEGMVIDVPVEVGSSITEANNFNAGTTIAAIADMNDMIFEGQVDESEVGKLEKDMELDIKIGAIEGKRFKGTLEHIAPKGALVEGAIQFELRAALALNDKDFVRAGYSANANIVLDRRSQVLTISEATLQFEGSKPFVEVAVGRQKFERREIETGLSDGIYIEITEGLTKNEMVKKPLRVRREH